MIISDYHNHTYFSADCDASAESMIEKAISLGLSYLCITDHMDPDMNFPDIPSFTFIKRKWQMEKGMKKEMEKEKWRTP